jgi:hypothetical protein
MDRYRIRWSFSFFSRELINSLKLEALVETEAILAIGIYASLSSSDEQPAFNTTGLPGGFLCFRL